MEHKGCGIICEYNPFHNGHKFQLKKARELCPFTVCAMSGDFVQRGAPAFQKKEVRAQNAVSGGADIVLEIPFPYSSMSAEGFAKSGVELLTKSGLCSHIMFGSECADSSVLYDIAKLASKDGFYQKVVEFQKKDRSNSFAKARQQIVSSELGEDYAKVLDNPNDILAVEYIKALIKLNSPLIPVPLKRSTPRGGFDDSFASSSYIRANLFDESKESFVKSNLPENYDYSHIYENTESFYSAVHISLMMKQPSMLEDILEVPSGYAHAIVQSARKAKSFDEMCSLLSGKSVTDSKIKRMLLFSFYGITQEVAKEALPYTFILALSQKGQEMLKKYRPDSNILTASRISDIKKDEHALNAYNRSRLALEVFNKCLL